jgi:hypothetical protein
LGEARDFPPKAAAPLLDKALPAFYDRESSPNFFKEIIS